MSKKEYVIAHDTAEYKNCLYCICGSDRAHAEKVLDRILNNPDEQDLAAIKNGYTNFRVEEVDSEGCWWNDSFLAN